MDMKVPPAWSSAAVGRVAQPPDALPPMLLPLEHSVAAPRKFHHFGCFRGGFRGAARRNANRSTKKSAA